MTQLRQKYPSAIFLAHFSSPTPIFSYAASLPYPANPFVSFVNLQERNHEGLFRSLQENKKVIQHKKKTKSKFHYFFLWFQFFELYIWTFIHEMRRNPKCLILVPFISFKSNPIFHLSNIVCWFNLWKWQKKKIHWWKIRNKRGIKFWEKREVKESQVLKPRHRHQKMRRNQLIQ